MKNVIIPEDEYNKIIVEKHELEQLKTENQQMQAQISQLEQQVKFLMEQITLNRHKRFGASSEKSEYDSDQMRLFNEAEATADTSQPEPEITTFATTVARGSYSRKKRCTAKESLPEGLEIEVVEHVLPDDEQSCPKCDGKLHVMGKEVIRRELKLIPAKAVVVEHVRYTYACRNCEKNGISVPVIKAPVPERAISGSFASPEAIAHIIHQKFVMYAPLYRQEQDWRRQGVNLSRQTMSNWLIKVSEAWLEPLYKELKSRLIKRDVLHADESTLQVLREPDKKAQSKSYMWLYRTSGDAKHPIVLYDYQPDRGSQRPKDFLAGFCGYLHCDGYGAYHSLPDNITVVGCFAHARRKFDEALKSIPKDQQAASAARVGRNYCSKLFWIERELAGLQADERHQKRQELAKPVLDAFFAWLKTINAGRSALGKAVQYTLKQWRYLTRYLLDGRLEISNNRAERSIKPFVMGRKNFLFANVPAGAKSSAVIYSIVETTKENGLNPYEYIAYLMRELPNRGERPLADFLPDSPSLPKKCYYLPKSKSEKDEYPWDESE